MFFLSIFHWLLVLLLSKANFQLFLKKFFIFINLSSWNQLNEMVTTGFTRRLGVYEVTSKNILFLFNSSFDINYRFFNIQYLKVEVESNIANLE